MWDKIGPKRSTLSMEKGSGLAPEIDFKVMCLCGVEPTVRMHWYNWPDTMDFQCAGCGRWYSVSTSGKEVGSVE